MKNPFMLRSTHEAIRDEFKEILDKYDRNDRLKTQLLDFHRVECKTFRQIADFWTLYHESASAEILALRAELEELRESSREKTLEEELADLDTIIQMTHESQAIVTKDRHKKRRDLDRLSREREELVNRINKELAPPAAQPSAPVAVST